MNKRHMGRRHLRRADECLKFYRDQDAPGWYRMVKSHYWAAPKYRQYGVRNVKVRFIR